jgi:hypothetical protein
VGFKTGITTEMRIAMGETRKCGKPGKVELRC